MLARALGRAGLLGLLLVSGCIRIGEPPTPKVWPIATKTVRVGSIDVEIDVGWAPVGARQVTLLTTVQNTSFIKSDRLAVRTDVEGFELAKGTRGWSGLVPLRTGIYHEVTYATLDGAQGGIVTIKVRRERSQVPSWRAELRFGQSNDGLRLVSTSIPQ